MKTPLEILQDTIIIPVHDFQKKYISRSAFHKVCKKSANYIFDHSKETALIMLGFNAISVISSHLAQIRGLKKSNRKNKDYLISQEKVELGTDILLTIIPPFAINNFLKKRLENGTITTKEARDKLINTVAPVVGVSRDELYNIEYIRPAKETFGSMVSNTLTKLLNSDRNLPVGLSVRLRRLNNKIKAKLPNPATKFDPPNLEKITTDFDNLAQSKKISNGILSKVKNGSAYDELYGMNNGLLILTTIGYTILASNVLMPIIKNKIANYRYEKQLKDSGETRESIKRKERFSYLETPPLKINKTSSPFDSFMENSFAAPKIPKDKIPKEETDTANTTKRSFNTFNNYDKIISQSSGLRI